MVTKVMAIQFQGQGHQFHLEVISKSCEMTGIDCFASLEQKGFETAK